MKIDFFGAVDSVTGSCHMISTDKHKVLLDCGLFQGGKELEAQNSEAFPFDPKEIQCVVLSHAHIDHSGRLPLLVKRGFSGEIFCTDATADLLKIMLPDCAHIQEKETEWKNRKAQRRGDKLEEPLYTMKDAEAVLSLVRPVLYDQLVQINDEMRIVFNEAGHILGSAITEIWTEDEGGSVKLVYTGDIGVVNKPILRDPIRIKKADYVIMESTYGDRVRESDDEQSLDELINIIVDTVKRGGNVVIPSFAVGRTQELIYELNRYYEGHMPHSEELKNVHVYIDSPLAISATEMFKRNAQVFDDETREYIMNGDNPLDFMNLHFTRTSEESKALNDDPQPKIIIAASGMCEAGRIRHHLKHNLWDAKNSIVFVGYQADGTLGRALLNGIEEVSLFDEKIAVRAHIYNLEGFSGHADRNALLNWVSGLQIAPRQIFLVHGEDESKKSLCALIREKTGFPCRAVCGVSEYEVSENRMSIEEADSDIADEETLTNLRNRLSLIHDNIEQILCSTRLAIGTQITSKQLMEISNSVLLLEKDMLGLGMLTSGPNRRGNE